MMVLTHVNPHFNALGVNVLGHSEGALSVGRQKANAYKKVRFSARLDPKADPKDQIQRVTKENNNNKVEGLSPLVRVLSVLSLFLGGVFGVVGPVVNKFQVDRMNQAMVQETELIQKKAQDLKQLSWLGKQVNVEPEARIIFNASQKQYREDLTAIQEELRKVRETYKDRLNEYIAFNLFVLPVGEASLAIGVVMASLIGMRIRRLGKRKGVLILKQPDKGRGYEEQVKYYKDLIPPACAAFSRWRLKAIQQDPDLASLMKTFYSPDELMSEKAHAQKLQSLYEALVYLEHSNPDENKEMLIDQFYKQVSSKLQYSGDETFFPEIELLERAFEQTPTPAWEVIEKNCYQHPHDPQTLQQLDDALAYLKNKQILNQLKICNYKIPFSRFIHSDEVQPEREEGKQARIEKLQAAEKKYVESEVFRSRFVQLHQMLQTLHPNSSENLIAEQGFKELTVLESLLAREQDNPVLKSILSDSKNSTS